MTVQHIINYLEAIAQGSATRICSRLLSVIRRYPPSRAPDKVRGHEEVMFFELQGILEMLFFELEDTLGF